MQLYVSEPELTIDLPQFGQKVQFNAFKHDSIDGFIKQNDECLVVLPQMIKNGELAIKSQVLPLTYEFP